MTCLLTVLLFWFLTGCKNSFPKEVLERNLKAIQDKEYTNLQNILYTDTIVTDNNDTRKLVGGYFKAAYPDSLEIVNFNIEELNDPYIPEKRLLNVTINYSNGKVDREKVEVKKDMDGNWKLVATKQDFHSPVLSALRYANVRAYSDMAIPYFQYLMSGFYKDGKYVEPNEDEYIYLIESSSAKIADANQALADYFMMPAVKGKQDLDKGIKYLMKAYEMGSDEATVSLAEVYLYGYGVEQDYEKGFKFAQEALDKKVPKADYVMGIIYAEGMGKDIDNKKAVEYFQKGAESEERNSIGRLGYMYYQGNGVERNYEKAIEYFNKAIELGDQGLSLAALGLCYYNGNGVSKDTEKGKELLKQASDAGNNFATSELNSIQTQERQTAQAQAAEARRQAQQLNYQSQRQTQVQTRRPRRRTCVYCGGQGTIRQSTGYDFQNHRNIYQTYRCTHCYGYGYVEE